MSVHLYGIRHHGPGSARSLLSALESLRPDAILVEGPPDGQEMLPFVLHAEMEPPVALLLFAPDDPRRAAYYPFATFSPEWQAIRYGLERGITVRFMDLPQAHQMALAAAEAAREHEASEPSETAAEGDDRTAASEEAPGDQNERSLRADPLRWLAEAAGYSDGERWWEHMVEHRRDSADLFQGIAEAMTSLRDLLESEAVSPLAPNPGGGPSPDREAERYASPASRLPPPASRLQTREAFMRQTIRKAKAEGFERIAVVCGAWHVPALARTPRVKEDDALLKGLPKMKIEATWIPWTYGRLAAESGYGAGIESPGWYHHLWHAPDRIVIRWMAHVARLLREADLDASSASVIEAVRLAEALAALRNQPLPGLPELNEAVRTVLCFGNEAPMLLLRNRLIVGEHLGAVPAETPMVPLQGDLARLQKRLRLPAEAAHRDYDLDLRRPNDLERSQLVHRLRLLGVPWGEPLASRGRGTFHEVWRLQWKPEFMLELIQAGIWGSTVLDAATALARARAETAPDLPTLTALADSVLLADLPAVVELLMRRLESQAAVTSDVSHLMDTLPRMAEMVRYPNVRQTDRGMLERVIAGLVARTCIGLPGACSSLDDDAAGRMYGRIVNVHRAIGILENAEHRAAWTGLLAQLADRPGLHGLIAGRCTWLSFDSGAFDLDDTARRMGLALSTAVDPAQAAAWLEGFLRENGQLLIHTDALFRVLDDWVSGLFADTFPALLPLLRRTFSTFPAPERRHLGERVKSGQTRAGAAAETEAEFDSERAARVLPLIRMLLGITGASDV